jgi:hypothetical protein
MNHFAFAPVMPTGKNREVFHGEQERETHTIASDPGSLLSDSAGPLVKGHPVGVNSCGLRLMHPVVQFTPQWKASSMGGPEFPLFTALFMGKGIISAGPQHYRNLWICWSPS